MNSIENLKRGEVLLTNAKEVSGNKIQLEFAEIIDDPNRSVSAVGIFNKKDSRFSGAKPRRAWLTTTKEEAAQILGLPQLASFEGTIDLNIKNVKAEGMELHVEVQEKTFPDPNNKWQYDNMERAAKINPRTEEYLLSDTGMLIFSNTRVVLGKAKHAFVEVQRDEMGNAITTDDVNPFYRVYAEIYGEDVATVTEAAEVTEEQSITTEKATQVVEQKPESQAAKK